MDNDSHRRQGHGSFKSTVVTRFLTPIAAAAASAAAGYAAKKAPDFFERTLLPRLRSVAGDAGGVTRDLPSRAASVASSAGDVAHDLTERAKSLVPAGVPGASSGNGSTERPTRSARELQQRREERSRARNERRKARSS